MKAIEFKITPETIRRANNSLIRNGIDPKVRERYNGVITTRINVNGVIKIREISREKIDEAYEKSLKEYVAKL